MHGVCEFPVRGVAHGASRTRYCFVGVPEERRILYFIMAVTLTTVAGVLGPIPMVGEYLTAILTNLSTVINAGAVAVILVIVYERVTE
ncbi:MAG: hypothetical protein O7C67_04090 [Gammaproteobacteria bacterium]|nr:hypothetical protein [Gammaproteobacteria bacterium]